MKQLGYIGFDQHGQTYHIKKHPRKELCEQLYRTSAAKMYVDTIDGKIRHTGYIVAGMWITIYRVGKWKQAI